MAGSIGGCRQGIGEIDAIDQDSLRCAFRGNFCGNELCCLKSVCAINALNYQIHSNQLIFDLLTDGSDSSQDDDLVSIQALVSSAVTAGRLVGAVSRMGAFRA